MFPTFYIITETLEKSITDWSGLFMGSNTCCYCCNILMVMCILMLRLYLKFVFVKTYLSLSREYWYLSRELHYLDVQIKHIGFLKGFIYVWYPDKLRELQLICEAVKKHFHVVQRVFTVGIAGCEE